MALDRSPTLKRVYEQPVWVIVCLFVSKPYRCRGLIGLLIQAAIQYVGQQGAKIVEAYPLHTEITISLPYERYMGIESAIERAGFQVAARRSERRPGMRFTIEAEP